MASLNISAYDDARTLGAVLAQLLAQTPMPCLFRGEMGSGKTALISQIVINLPGGQSAEPSSPSFTICNCYPTDPPVLHCDLYRVARADAIEEIYEFLQENRGILMVEWAGKLPPLPSPYLDIFLNVVNDRRIAEIIGYGSAGASVERQLAALLSMLIP